MLLVDLQLSNDQSCADMWTAKMFFAVLEETGYERIASLRYSAAADFDAPMQDATAPARFYLFEEIFPYIGQPYYKIALPVLVLLSYQVCYARFSASLVWHAGCI